MNQHGLLFNQTFHIIRITQAPHASRSKSCVDQSQWTQAGVIWICIISVDAGDAETTTQLYIALWSASV